MAAKRSLFLLVMKTMELKESFLWMMLMVNVCSLCTCDAARRGAELEQMDATHSGSEPIAPSIGHVVTLRTSESMDLNDVSSGYVSGSAWESIPPSPLQLREPDKSGVLTPDQGFQSGDNIQAKEALADVPEAKSDPHSGDFDQMLKDDLVTVHNATLSSHRKPAKTTQDGEGEHTIRKTVPEMTSTDNVVSSFTSGSTDMLTPSLGFTPTVERLLGDDDVDRKVHGVKHRASTTSKAPLRSVTKAAKSGTTSLITAKGTATTAAAKKEEKETMTTIKEAHLFTETKTSSGVLENLVTPDPESRLTKSSNAPTALPSPDRSRAFGTTNYVNVSADARIFVTRNERYSNRSDAKGMTSTWTRDETSTEDTYTLGHVTAHPDREARPPNVTNGSFTSVSAAEEESVTMPDNNEARSSSEDGTTTASSRGDVSAEVSAVVTNSDPTEPQTGYFTTAAAGLFITQMEHKTSDSSSSSSSSTQGVSLPRFTADGSYGPTVYRTRRQTSEHTDGDTFRLTTADVSSTTPSNMGDSTSPGLPSASTLASETTPGFTVGASQTLDQPGQEETTYEAPSVTTAGKLSTSDYGSESTLADTTLKVIASSTFTTTTMTTEATSSSEPPLTTSTTTMKPITCPPGFFKSNLLCLKEPDNVQVKVLYENCVHLTWSGGGFSYNVTIRSVTDGGRAIYTDHTTNTNAWLCRKIPPGSTFVVAVVLREGGEEALSEVITLEPSRPENLKLSDSNETCVALQWSPGSTGHTDSYTVHMTTAGSTPGNDVTVHAETNETSWTQCGLTPGASFNLSVFSFSNSVRSRDAAILKLISTAPSPPTDGQGVPCHWNRQGCIDVQWAAGEGQSSGRYKVVRLATPTRGKKIQRVDGTNTNFTRLEPATKYTVRIKAISQAGRLSLSPLEVKVCTAPEPVTSIRLHRVDSTWVEFWWNQQNSAIDYYILQWNDTQDGISSMRVESGVQNLKKDGLRPGTIYDFRLVTVFCELQTVSDPLTITTELSDLTVEVEPLGTSLNISWAMDGKQTTSSQILVFVVMDIKRADGRGGVTKKSTYKSPYIYDTHLSGTCFSITLTPYKHRKPGKSFAVHAYTDEAAPEEVTNVQAHRLLNDRAAINVTWSRPNVTNGVVSQYDVLVRGRQNLRRVNSTLSCQTDCQAKCPGQSDPISRTRVQRHVPDSTFSGGEEDFFVLVGNLSEYENYDVQVLAATMTGRGPPATVIVLGQLLDLVTDLTITVRNASCLHLTWDLPVNALNSSGVSYLVEYGRRDEVVEDVRLDEVAVVNTTETAILVCGLEFWTMYYFNITAFDMDGLAGKTETASERTAEHVPDKVVNLTVATETDIMQPRKLSVRWSEPVHKYGRIISYYVAILNNHTRKIVGEKDVSPRSHLNDSTGIYFSEDFLLVGDVGYTVQVIGATSAGNGSVARTYIRMPAGAVPRKGQNVYRGPKTSVGMETAHVGLPWNFLCDVDKYGRTVMAGYIVFREKWRGAVKGIRDGGVSVGPRPVVTKTWKQSNQDAPDVAFFVQLPVRPLRHSCSRVANRTFGIPVEVGSRSRTGSGSLCTDRLEGGATAAAGVEGGVVQCGGGPLRPDTVYHVQAVVCTATACSYSYPSPSFRTLQPPVTVDSGSDVLVAGMSVCVLLIVLGGIGSGYIIYRRRRKTPSPVPSTSRSEPPHTMTEAVCRSRPVAVHDFIAHVEQMHQDANVGFSAEYKLIKDESPTYSTEYADIQVNKPKNRYKNILPWDRTRVELLATDDEEGSDYINANYIPGWKHQREFIAAQGPLSGTIDDFWRMVWENRVSVVVMLTQCVEKGRTKCEQYWPKEGAQEIYGDLVVHLRSESVLPDYIIRVIDFTCGTQSRIIKQFHFMQWPDFGCPERTSMLLSFVSSVRAHMPHSDCGPMVVHCSAGVGRTGTFIALDQLLQQIHGQTEEVDIFGLVMKMREHRTMMVQTENQYIYIHDCLADALTKDRESDDEEQSGEEEDEHIYENC